MALKFIILLSGLFLLPASSFADLPHGVENLKIWFCSASDQQSYLKKSFVLDPQGDRVTPKKQEKQKNEIKKLTHQSCFQELTKNPYEVINDYNTQLAYQCQKSELNGHYNLNAITTDSLGVIQQTNTVIQKLSLDSCTRFVENHLKRTKPYLRCARFEDGIDGYALIHQFTVENNGEHLSDEVEIVSSITEATCYRIKSLTDKKQISGELPFVF